MHASDGDSRSHPLSQLLTELAEESVTRRAAQLHRQQVVIDAISAARVQIQGRWLTNWCSNDYLGLSTHPALVQAAAEAAQALGVGARASRLLAGTTRWHDELESRLAAWYGAESAIVFSSGYLTNWGALTTLLSARDEVLIDRLAHASLVDAVRASRAHLRVFRHNDPAHIAQVWARPSRARRRMIVTEGVFSMDGDRAPLADLATMASRTGALLYVDDAHGAFMLGSHGRGAPQAAGVPLDQLVYVATLGKALGCQGGAIIGPRVLIDALRHQARSYVFATALAVPVAAAACTALRVLEQAGDPLRQRLWNRVRRLAAQLSRLTQVSQDPSAIVPILVGESSTAVRIAQALWDRGCWAPAIRPPTVPRGTARLRISVTVAHTDEQIDHLANSLKDVLGHKRPVTSDQ